MMLMWTTIKTSTRVGIRGWGDQVEGVVSHLFFFNGFPKGRVRGEGKKQQPTKAPPATRKRS